MTDRSWHHTVVTAEYRVPPTLVSPRTHGHIGAYRRLAAAILGVDVATLTQELHMRRIENYGAPKAA